MTVGILVVTLAVWLVFEKSGYTLLSLVSSVLLLLLAILFLWAKSAAILNRYASLLWLDLLVFCQILKHIPIEAVQDTLWDIVHSMILYDLILSFYPLSSFCFKVLIHSIPMNKWFVVEI